MEDNPMQLCNVPFFSHLRPLFPFKSPGKVSAFDGEAEGGENKKEKAPQSKGVLVTDTYAFNDQFT